MNQIIEGLKKHKWYKGQILDTKIIPVKSGEFEELSPSLPPSVQEYLR